MKRLVIVLVAAGLVLSSASADFLWWKTRSPLRDVGRAVGRKLAEEETRLATYAMTYYCIVYGYAVKGEKLEDSCRRMTKEEYDHSVRQSARFCTSPAAKGLLAFGEAGEKLLKALIATAEDAAKSTGGYIEKKSDEYDSRSGK